MSYFPKKSSVYMRKLVSLARVLAIHPIEGADAIERIQVKGWNLVSAKGTFEPGDLCAYFEIDSFLPVRPEFEFLRKSSYKETADGSKGFKLKTIKLRGQISQGLALPIREIAHLLPSDFVYEEDAEITDYLGVTKWDTESVVTSNGLGRMFPDFISKTDEERVQNLQRMLSDIVGTQAYIAEKVDGSSMTVYIKDGVFGVCSRNTDLNEETGGHFWELARKLNLEEKLRRFGRNIAIQGEIYGEGIQGNKLKMKGKHFALFTAVDIDDQHYYDYDELMEMAMALEIETVPILTSEHYITANIDEYIKLATMKSKINPDVWAEGIVIRSVTRQNWRGSRISFKAISPTFLLKYGE